MVQLKDHGGVYVALGAGIAVFIAMAIGAAFTDNFPGDAAVMRAAQRPDWFEEVAHFFHIPIDDWVIRYGAAVFVIGLLIARQWPFALAFAATWVAAGLSFAAKELVARPRPEGAFEVHVAADTPSFPSGHAFNAAIFGTLIALAALRWLPPLYARLVVAAAVVFALLAGFARFWLGVHWLSDAIGGWILGAWCAGVAWLAAEYVNEWREARREARRVASREDDRASAR